HLDTDRLSQDQVFTIVNTQLANQARKKQNQLYFAGFIAVLFFVFLILALKHVDQEKVPEPQTAQAAQPADTNTSTTPNAGTTPTAQPGDTGSGQSPTVPGAASPIPNSRLYNVAGKPYVKLVLRSALLKRLDTIEVPREVNVKGLRESIMSYYDFENKVLPRYNANATISWRLDHENRPADEDELLTAARWNDFDNIQVKFDVVERSRGVTSPNPFHDKDRGNSKGRSK
ncbi:MAG: hypothetical protein JNL72_15685, partial [Flavipsychrobacter sp.]|nr:hypothetical protein [Flavipsychrobacter sp.]